MIEELILNKALDMVSNLFDQITATKLKSAPSIYLFALFFLQ